MIADEAVCAVDPSTRRYGATDGDVVDWRCDVVQGGQEAPVV